MKKSRILLAIAWMLMTLTFAGVGGRTQVQAATLTNVMKAPKAKKGQWVIAKKGYRYRYTATKKYAKSVWLKIGGKIYYFKKDGYLKTGWRTYNGKKYYFNTDGTLVTGWKKIGSYYYYFYKTNGSMAVNKKIGSYTVDSKGRRVSAVSSAAKTKSSTTSSSTTATTSSGTSSSTKKTGTVDLFVGDSRTVGMAVSVGKISYSSQVASGKWLAKVGAGYSWYTGTALAKIKNKLKKNPTATVVLNFGVNDLGNCSKYISSYKALIKAYPKAHIYIMSVNPTDSSKYSGSATNTAIKSFNEKMKKAFPNQYIDTFTYLKKNGFSTVDGLHYTTDTYKKIYKYVLTKV